MAQEQVTKLENALIKSLDEIDKTYTRKIQGDMHRCAAGCCDRKSDSVENVYSCIKNCASEFEKAQRYLQAEYSQFQDRLQRCVLQCSDEVVDKIGGRPSPSDISKLNREHELCVIACTTKHLNMIPDFMKRVKEVLHKKMYDRFGPLDDDPKSLRAPSLL